VKFHHKYHHCSFSEKNLFRITCNRAIDDFIKETHFYNPVQNMCIVSVVSILSQLYCTVRVLHSLLPHLFNSFFIRSFTNNLQHWTACHVLMVKPRSQSLINSHNNDHDRQQWNVTIYAAQCTTYISLQNTNEQSWLRDNNHKTLGQAIDKAQSLLSAITKQLRYLKVIQTNYIAFHLTHRHLFVYSLISKNHTSEIF